MYHVFLTTGAWTTHRYHFLFSCVCIQLTSGHHTSHVTQCAGPRHTKIEGHAMASRREAKRFAPAHRRRRSAGHPTERRLAMSDVTEHAASPLSRSLE